MLLSILVCSRFGSFILRLPKFRLVGCHLISLLFQLFIHLILFYFLLLYPVLWSLPLDLLFEYSSGHCLLFLCFPSILLFMIFIFLLHLISFPYSYICFLLGLFLLLNLSEILIFSHDFYLLLDYLLFPVSLWLLDDLVSSGDRYWWLLFYKSVLFLDYLLAVVSAPALFILQIKSN